MRSFLSIIAAPVLCLGVVGAATWENSRHAKPADAVAFHTAAKDAIDAWPARVGDWVGRDRELPPAAVNLLKPNAHFCREFWNTQDKWRRPVSLLVVQCRRASDMSGHYPPNCYPRNGKPLIFQKQREWNVPGQGLDPGMEYHFEYGTVLHPQKTIVYNFFVLPDQGVVPDMAQVREASGNFQRRHFGAAQIQVVFDEDPDTDGGWRDQMFMDLIGSNPGVLKVLSQAIK